MLALVVVLQVDRHLFDRGGLTLLSPMSGRREIVRLAAYLLVAFLGLAWVEAHDVGSSYARWAGRNRFGEACAWAALLYGSFVVVLSHASSRLYLSWSYEDSLVENLGFLALLIGGACAVRALFGLQARVVDHRRWHVAACAALILFTFVLAGEEVSWGQRVFHFATPSSFSGNAKGEVNLHNFETNFFEWWLHCAVILAFWIVPYLAHRLSWADRLGAFALYLPPRGLGLAAAIAASFTYDRWATSSYLLVFYLAVLVCALDAFRKELPAFARLQAGGFLLAVLVFQASHFYTDAPFPYFRQNLQLEYRETLLECLIAAYAFTVMRRHAGAHVQIR